MGSPIRSRAVFQVVLCLAFLVSAVAAQVNVIKAVGDEVSFLPVTFNPPVTSITWKQKTNGGNDVTKAIEWDGEETDPTLRITVPNPRFKNITTLNEKTGQITIKKLRSEHAGVYTIEINSKEQEQRFTLTVMDVVVVPKVTIEISERNPDAAYLYCNYNETIIWKNSAGETLTGKSNGVKGQFILVEKSDNPENYYTCTLKNAVSEKTSDRVYEKNLFKAKSDIGPLLGGILGSLFVIALFVIPPALYKFCKPIHDPVQKFFGEKPCIGAVLTCLDGKKKDKKAETPQNGSEMEVHKPLKHEDV